MAEDDVDIILYAHPSMAKLATRIEELCNEGVDKKFKSEGGKRKTVCMCNIEHGAVHSVFVAEYYSV